MKKGGEDERIIDYLEKSGYPLEINATLTLESNGWNVINQSGYLDIESNKWRTIDVIATKNVPLLDSSVYERLHVSLIIECKKTDKPWVFWVREKKGMRIFNPLAAVGVIKLESKPWLHPLHYEKLAESFHYYFPDFDKVGVISFEAFSKKGEGGNIFEAKNQVIKALLYERTQTRNFLAMQEAKEKVTKEKTINLLLLTYPVIIFEGHICELEYKGNRPTLTRSHYVQYLTSFGYPTPEEFVIDIVDINFLNNYLKMLDEEAKKLSQKFSTLKSPSQVST